MSALCVGRVSFSLSWVARSTLRAHVVLSSSPSLCSPPPGSPCFLGYRVRASFSSSLVVESSIGGFGVYLLRSVYLSKGLHARSFVQLWSWHRPAFSGSGVPDSGLDASGVRARVLVFEQVS